LDRENAARGERAWRGRAAAVTLVGAAHAIALQHVPNDVERRRVNDKRASARPVQGNEVPIRHYQTMRRRYPAFMDAVERLGAAAHETGPLVDKTKERIQLAAAATLGSEGSVHSHARRALQAGATVGELHHTLLLLVCTIGFPTVAAAMSWVDDTVDGRREPEARRMRGGVALPTGDNPASADGGIHY
jgi:AhpD family alkylhydroperoxidase